MMLLGCAAWLCCLAVLLLLLILQSPYHPIAVCSTHQQLQEQYLAACDDDS
jgi:hypothetical protein